VSKPHAPAFAGPQINIPEGSRGEINASTPRDQRVPDRITEVGTGPVTEEIYGGITTYQPARYAVTQVVENRHGDPVEHTIIREDR
jgi:hypothetical protein